MIIYEGPVKLMLCFVAEVATDAKSVGQDPNIISGGQSVSFKTYLTKLLHDQTTFWMNQGLFHLTTAVVVMVICRGEFSLI